MTWLKGAKAPLAPSPWLRHRLRPKKILGVLQKKTKQLSFKVFSRSLLFQVTITYEAPVPIL